MKDWKFIKVGNESLITKDGRVNYPDKAIGEINILKKELEGLMRMAEKDKNNDYSKQIDALKKEISEKKNKYATGNESIDKQEWSMFEGLTKKAESEVGNEYKPNTELIKILEAWLHNRMSEQEARAKIMKITGDKNITDMMIHSPGGFIPAGNKVGNRAIYDDSGRFIIGYVEKNGNGYSAYTHGITGSKSYLLDAKDEKTAEAELKDYVKAYEKRTGNAEPKLTDMTGKNGSGVVERMSNLYFVSYNLNNGEKGIEKFPTESQAISFLKKKIGNGKVYNARSKEQLLADVRELTKYIKDNPDSSCEKEKRLLGEAKEELDKRYGVIVGNFKTGKSKLSVGDKVSLYGVKGTVKGITGENSDNIYGEPVIEFESEDGKTKQVPEHYLVKVGNAVIDLREPDPTGEIQASGMKRYYQLMDEYEKKKKKVDGIYKDKDGKKFHVHLYGPDSGYNSGNYGITGEGIYSITKVVKELPRGFVKVGNESIGDEYNAEINRLYKKKMDLERMGQGKKAKEIEKQILQLQKELREYDIGNKVGNWTPGQTGKPGTIAAIGPAWMYGGTVYGKMDTDEKGKKHNEYVKITWLGSDKGGVANYFVDGKMQSDKFGSLDKNELKRWAEKKIGNTAHSDKVEVIKRLLSGGWSVEDIYSQLKTEGYEVEKGFIEKLKTGNETLAEYAKSKPRIINNLQRARNAMNKKCGNQQITLWDGNDSVLISEDGTVQYLESNSFEVDRDKYDSQQKAVEELTKQGYRKK